MKNVYFAVAVSLLCLVSLCESADERRLIAFNETTRVWMTRQEMETLYRDKIRFIDLTDHQDMTPSPIPGLVYADIPKQPLYKTYVNSILPSLSQNQISTTIGALSALFTRYYTSSTGVDAANLIKDKFTQFKADRDDITVSLFTHTWAQPSVIARIPGKGPNSDEIVILGSHEDSVGSSSTSRSPGADDDASGVATILEAFRVLVANGYVPDRTVEFHTYAGEEAGLLGSQAIAKQYKADGKLVHTQMQFDMTGYNTKNNVGIITDYTNANLTAFLRLLVDTYSALTWTDSRCGYGCSDHASWTNAGYRAAFPFEAPFGSHSPYIHTANDLLSNINPAHCLEFARIAVGYAVELAGVGGI